MTVFSLLFFNMDISHDIRPANTMFYICIKTFLSREEHLKFSIEALVFMLWQGTGNISVVFFDNFEKVYVSA